MQDVLGGVGCELGGIQGQPGCVQGAQCHLGSMVNVACVGFGDEQLAEVWHAPAETGFDSQDHLQAIGVWGGAHRRHTPPGKKAAVQDSHQGAASSCGS